MSAGKRLGVVAVWAAAFLAVAAWGGPREDEGYEARIKHGTDREARKVAKKPIETTIGALLSIPRPLVLPADGKRIGENRHRFAPLESKVWRVRAVLERIQIRKDGDVYLVFKDGAGHELACEAPEPEECRGSPFIVSIRIVRTQLAALKPGKDASEIHRKATVEGIGFFARSKIDGENGARLMPLLAIRWEKG